MGTESMYGRVREFIQDGGGDGLTSREIAEKVSANVSDAEWSDWAESVAITALVDMVGQVIRKERVRLKFLTRSEQLERIEAGEDFTSVFDLPVSVDGVWKRQGSLRKPDCLVVSGDYDSQSKTAALESRFFAAVAKKLGTKAVEEVFEEDQFQKLHQSIVG